MGIQLFAGIKRDLAARRPWYRSDWTEGFNSGYRILAPAVYVFFSSALPALAFGEQIDKDTDGAFNGVHVLVSSALFGVLQSIFGGQPLLILGVAEPIVLMYMFMYDFAKSQNFEDVFVPWCVWVLIFCSCFIFILAAIGACELMQKFTRFSGELFGMLIAILFMQQAIKGVVGEFQIKRLCDTSLPGCEPYSAAYKLVNGLWAVILSVGLVATSMFLRTARSWRILKGGLRSFIADYGVPIMVVVWTLVSYTLQDVTPKNIPRRLAMPNTWDTGGSNSNWTAASRFASDVSGAQIGYALVPALIIALLFYFDHSVSAQLTQQPDFQLVRPPAYNYDLALLAVFMLVAAFMGVPPSNCVIPQSPLHTKSLMTLRKMLLPKEAKDEARRSKQDLQAIQEGSSDRTSSPEAAGGDPKIGSLTVANPDERSLQGESLPSQFKRGVIPITVTEQRLSGLLQSLFIGLAVAATPIVRLIPKSVLWGYFAYMALESLPGSEFYDRISLVFTDRRKRIDALKEDHPAYLETVTYRNIVVFTAVQTFFCLAVYAVTWAGIAGIFFPIFILALIPCRQYIMPRFFDAWTLSQLDAAEYEEAAPAPPGVVHELAKQASVDVDAPVRGGSTEAHDVLERESVGVRAIKHHVTRDEMEARTSLSRASRDAALARTSPRTSPALRERRTGGSYELTADQV